MYDDYVTSFRFESNFIIAFVALAEDHEPTSFKKTCESISAGRWSCAMEEEMESLHINKTWDLVQLPKG